MKSIVFLILLFFIFVGQSIAQSVGINDDASAPNPSALFDLKSNSKGLLIPRMSTSQRNAIADPAAGLLVFDLDKSTIYLFDGQKWQAMLFTSSGNNNPPIGRSASDGAASDKFGISVSISGDYAIVGAHLVDGDAKTDQGAAYIFARQDGTWLEQAKLTASDGRAGDNFGISVGINGDYVVVGAPKAGGIWFLQGAAYIFMRTGTTWLQQAKLTASDGVIGENFGTSVSIDGNYIIAGAPNARVQYANEGAAYVFVRTGTVWTQQSKLVVSYGEYNDHFGNSVSISGDHAILGAPFRDANIYVADVGAAYIFVRNGNTWTLQIDLYYSEGDAGDNFGASVCITDSYAMVGAPNFDLPPFTDNGAVFVYGRTGLNWSLPKKLTAADAESASYFGNSVSISGDNAVIGNYYDDVGSNPIQGSAYIYSRSGNTWALLRKVDDGSGMPAGLFGSAVGVSGYNYFISAIGKNNSKGEVNFLNIE